MKRPILRTIAVIIIVCFTGFIVVAGAALASFMLRAAHAAETPSASVVIPARPAEQPRTPETICGVYVFMAQSLLQNGYEKIGSGVVNPQLDRWVLFQQTSGPEPHLWVVLIWVTTEPYQGLEVGSACEIVVGRSWVAENL